MKKITPKPKELYHIEGTFKTEMSSNSLNFFCKLFERSDMLDSFSSKVRLAYLTLGLAFPLESLDIVNDLWTFFR